ncbi:MAG TPA: hypothetical protein ENI05_13295 [Porticoccus sp.]|nr:hypothetical protein [Porticoccus sp.]
MKNDILIIFRPEDPSKECFSAIHKDWQEVIIGCSTPSNASADEAKASAIQQLATEQECLDIYDFSAMTIDEVIDSINGAHTKPGQRSKEAHALYLNLLMLDYPHLEVIRDDDTVTISVNEVYLHRSATNDPFDWSMTAIYPDTGNNIQVGRIIFTTLHSFLSLLVKLTWIDKTVGFYKDQGMYEKAIGNAINQAAIKQAA